MRWRGAGGDGSELALVLDLRNRKPDRFMRVFPACVRDIRCGALTRSEQRGERRHFFTSTFGSELNGARRKFPIKKRKGEWQVAGNSRIAHSPFRRNGCRLSRELP